MFLIGKSSYENSIKEYNFTINKTPVTEVTANDYVEKIADAKPEDYKTALGMVIKVIPSVVVTVARWLIRSASF